MLSMNGIPRILLLKYENHNIPNISFRMASLDDPICQMQIVCLLLYYFLIEDPLTDFLIQNRPYEQY